MRVRENKWPDSSFFLVGLMFFPRNIRPRNDAMTVYMATLLQTGLAGGTTCSKLPCAGHSNCGGRGGPGGRRSPGF